jgi:hypothetical protein
LLFFPQILAFFQGDKNTMADWIVAYNWMMDFEDPKRACAQIPDAAPAGCVGPCHAISGINSGAWPAQFQVIANTPQNQRSPLVRQFYQQHFWNNWFAQIASDELCKRVFDFAVNGGTGQAVLCLQQALNSLHTNGAAPLKEDGGWGPMTLATVNDADADALLTAFKAQRTAHYGAIAAAHPADAQYLPEWLARARK